MKTKINYVIGDATEPIGDGVKIIAHVCNDVGAWGAGFVMALSKKWPEPEECYRNGNITKLKLGTVVYVPIKGEDITVANMIAQRGVGYDNTGFPPIRYNSLRTCLGDVAYVINDMHDGLPSVHMPRIGCGLAGGKWDIVSTIIEDTLCAAGIPVYVYDLA